MRGDVPSLDTQRESFREEAAIMTIAHSVLSVSFGPKVRRPAAEQIHQAAVAPVASSPLSGGICLDTVRVSALIMLQ